MTLYKKISTEEDALCQYVGVYATKWRPEWGRPDVLFVEDDTHSELLEASKELAKEAQELVEDIMANAHQLQLRAQVAATTVRIGKVKNIIDRIEDDR